jgi:hypothetical protein
MQIWVLTPFEITLCTVTDGTKRIAASMFHGVVYLLLIVRDRILFHE